MNILKGTVLVMTLMTGILMYSCPLGDFKMKDERMAKIAKSKNYSEEQFHNTVEYHAPSYFKILGKYLSTKPKDTESTVPLPMIRLNKEMLEEVNQNDLKFIWLGHATILFQIEGKTYLTDPMFSKRPSFIQSFGPMLRFHPVPIDPNELPEIESVLISHNHYDHLDEYSAKVLKSKTKRFLVPLGVGELLETWGVPSEKIVELDWWERINFDDIQFISTPSFHFSGRGLFDRNETLWASWVIKSQRFSIYFSGDTGMFHTFKEIGEKYGPFDLTLIPIGAYDSLWHDAHLFPEEAIQAHKDLKGKLLMPIHWGTFDMAFHSWYDPAERLYQAAKAENIQVVSPLLGQPISFENLPITTPWWRELKTLRAKK